jgi:hypothetical protein
MRIFFRSVGSRFFAMGFGFEGFAEDFAMGFFTWETMGVWETMGNWLSGRK